MDQGSHGYMILKDVMAQPHGAHVDVLAVVSFVGAVDPISGLVELYLCDKRLLLFTVLHS